jgi:DeoR/GlpR family transcriptional regulator of sugar metabolism
VCDLNRIDVLVTDADITPEAADSLRESGVSVVAV